VCGVCVCVCVCVCYFVLFARLAKRALVDLGVNGSDQ
jgi:hypothetical protein